MSFYPSETNTSAQQQWKEAKVPPLWTLGLIKSRTWQDPAENGEILPGYRETEITAGGIKWKGMQKNPGNIWIMGLQRRETMGAEAFRSLWISTSFLVYFALSHLQFEIYWNIPKSHSLFWKRVVLFCFSYHTPGEQRWCQGSYNHSFYWISAWLRKAGIQVYGLQDLGLNSLKLGHKN